MALSLRQSFSTVDSQRSELHTARRRGRISSINALIPSARLPLYDVAEVSGTENIKDSGIVSGRSSARLIGQNVSANQKSGSSSAGSSSHDKPWYKNPLKILKIAIIHIVLLITLLLYTYGGARIVAMIEADKDIEVQQQHLSKISARHEQIILGSWNKHLNGKQMSKEEWKEYWYSELQKLSVDHDGSEMLLDESKLKSRWSIHHAILYTVTRFGACGFSMVEVLTDSGQIFTVTASLIGIPLMFMTAADISKSLLSVATEVHTRVPFRRLCCRKTPAAAESARLKQEQNGKPETALLSQRSNVTVHSTKSAVSATTAAAASEGRLSVAVGAYIGLILSYSALGGFFYSFAEQWNFLEAFHVSFRTIVTMGLASINVDTWSYLAMNVSYVIIGISIVSICIDVASARMKVYFRRIHYFGRQMPRDAIAENLNDLRRLVNSNVAQYLFRLHYGAGGDEDSFKVLESLMKSQGIDRNFRVLARLMAESADINVVPKIDLGLLDMPDSARTLRLRPYEPFDMEYFWYIDESVRSSRRSPKPTLSWTSSLWRCSDGCSSGSMVPSGERAPNRPSTVRRCSTLKHLQLSSIDEECHEGTESVRLPRRSVTRAKRGGRSRALEVPLGVPAYLSRSLGHIQSAEVAVHQPAAVRASFDEMLGARRHLSESGLTHDDPKPTTT